MLHTTWGKIRPSQFILVCGTNDIPELDWSDIRSTEEIAASLIDIGRLARTYGVSDVRISSIIVRRGRWFAQKIEKVNRLLQASCIQEGFHFLDNSSIDLLHLDNRGLHLNFYGSAVLKIPGNTTGGGQVLLFLIIIIMKPSKRLSYVGKL